MTQYYENYEDARNAARALGVKTESEYRLERQKDTLLPESPEDAYAEVWKENGGWKGFLGAWRYHSTDEKETVEYYSWDEAKTALKKLEISSRTDFLLKKPHKIDSRIPSNPAKTYADVWKKNGGWSGLIDPDYAFYKTIEEASEAAQKLDIKTVEEYVFLKRYKEDPKLPSNPDDIYKREWTSFGKWSGFLGIRKKEVYKTWNEASKAAQKLKIKTATEYRKQYKNDPKLPADPKKVYAEDWINNGEWKGFLQKDPKNEPYPTYSEAKAAAKKLGIQSVFEYNVRRNEDPRLPSNPNIMYGLTWIEKGEWCGFLKGNKNTQFYKTFKEASKAAVALKITNGHEYYLKRHLDPKLPPWPPATYSSDWSNRTWPDFLQQPKKKNTSLYPSFKEASHAAQALKIKSSDEYLMQLKYTLDPRLPAKPEQSYKNEWEEQGGWPAFLRGESRARKYETFEEASQAAINLGIITCVEYRQRRAHEIDPRLPANPALRYKDVWDEKGKWPGFLKQKLKYTYEEAREKVRSYRMNTPSDYLKSRIWKIDPMLPREPNVYYSEEWDKHGGWADFLGSEFAGASRYYDSIKEASRAAQRLGIKNSIEYRGGKKYKEDPRLPSNPQSTYKSDWKSIGGWRGFLGVR